MTIDDDSELAEEVEAALKALGIARLRSQSVGPVQPLVRELRRTNHPARAPAGDWGAEPERNATMPAKQK